MAQLSDDEIQVDVKTALRLMMNYYCSHPRVIIGLAPRRFAINRGQNVSVAPGSGHIVSLKIPQSINAAHAMLVKIHGEP